MKKQFNEIAISIKDLTKDYGYKRGIFDISFDIPKGSVFGYCGTNGSGKTTTIRHIMGFIKPDKGSVKVFGYDAWKDSEIIKQLIGYIPGEIAFPDLATGKEFLEVQKELIKMDNFDKASNIINAMQLDPTANLKRMSKGMKQKTAIVSSMMNDPEILILDEPTTGLDPLMRASFVDLILEFKKQGKTIFMSSHMFEEMEDTCDFVGLIKDGHLIDIVKMDDIKNAKFKEYKIGFKTEKDFAIACKLEYKVIRKQEQYKQLTFKVNNKDLNKFLDDINPLDIEYLREIKYTLAAYFESIVETE